MGGTLGRDAIDALRIGLFNLARRLVLSFRSGPHSPRPRLGVGPHFPGSMKASGLLISSMHLKIKDKTGEEDAAASGENPKQGYLPR